MPRVQSATSASDQSVEIVPLKVFSAGGKRGMYLNFGLVTLDDDISN